MFSTYHLKGAVFVQDDGDHSSCDELGTHTHHRRHYNMKSRTLNLILLSLFTRISSIHRAGANPMGEIHPGQVANLSKGQHIETNKHTHILTYRQFKVSSQTCMQIFGWWEEAEDIKWSVQIQTHTDSPSGHSTRELPGWQPQWPQWRAEEWSRTWPSAPSLSDSPGAHTSQKKMSQ